MVTKGVRLVQKNIENSRRGLNLDYLGNILGKGAMEPRERKSNGGGCAGGVS